VALFADLQKITSVIFKQAAGDGYTS